jgi:Ca2+-transporting ATPase
MSQLIHVFECKSETGTLFHVKLFSNMKLVLAVIISFAILAAAVFLPQLQPIFRTITLTPNELLTALGFSAAVPLISSLSGIRFRDQS